MRVVGCGSQAPEAVAPGDGDAAEAAGSSIDDEGFEAAPTVAFTAPATTRFGNGHRLCTEHRTEISPEVASVLGYDIDGDRAALEARADGRQLAADVLDLAPDSLRLPEGYVSGYIDLGPLREGTTVELDVREDVGLASIRSHIVVDHCDVARATASCGGAGCMASTSLTIVPAGCRYSRPFDGL